MSGDTESVPLASITTWMSGGTPNRGNESYWSGTIPWISAATLKRSLIYDSDQFLTSAGLRAGSKLAPVGATLILVRGMALHRETRIGMAVRPVSFNQDVKALVPTAGVVPRFLMYALQARSAQILQLVSSAGSGTGVLDTQLLKRLTIWLPDEPTQQRVVGAIDDVGQQIQANERSIAKKEGVKQGMMQQLLTGKTRLAGFTKPWMDASVGSLLMEIKGGGTPSRTVSEYWNGGLPWATAKDFSTFTPHLTQESISLAGLTQSATRLVPKGTLLMCTRMAVGKVSIYDVDVCINQDVKALFLRPSVSPSFMARWFSLHEAGLLSIAGGSTVVGISVADLKAVTVPMPPELAEQQAITGVLRDVDAEIEALTACLDKARAINQGMMQELLSGRTRLPVKDSAT